MSEIKTFELSVLRVAMEYATFSDFRIRDSINTAIKAIEADLDEVGFEPSENTRETLEALESCITDVETEKAPREAPIEIDESEVEDVVEVEVEEVEDDEEEVKPRIINVDEELEEY